MSALLIIIDYDPDGLKLSIYSRIKEHRVKKDGIASIPSTKIVIRTVYWRRARREVLLASKLSTALV